MNLINKQDMLKNESKRKMWIGAGLLSVFSILAQYTLPIMSYGLILLFIYSVFLFLHRGKLIFNKSLTWFVLWCMVSQLVIYYNSGTFEKNINTYFFMFVVLFLLSTLAHIEKDVFFKIYYVIGVICSILVIYQFVMGSVLGVPQSAIKILPVAQENAHFWIHNQMRASGLFTEPQAFSSYVLPLLILLLFKRKIKGALFISFSIIASTSSQGIILALIIWGYYYIIFKGSGMKKFLYFLSVLTLSTVVVLTMFNVPALYPIISKIVAIDLFGYDIRLTKGFIILYEMPIWDKMIGIGMGNLSDYLAHGNLHFFWMSLTRPELFGYITTMSNVFISFGVIAFLLYINIFIKNWNCGTQEARLMLLVILISSFTQSSLFNAWFVFFWVVYEVFDSFDCRYISVKL